MCIGKVENILKGSLDSISSPSHSVKIQIMGGKVCLRCKGKIMLGIVNKLFVFKSLLAMTSNVLPLHLKKTFPTIIWIFAEGEGDVIESRLLFKIFSTLQKMKREGERRSNSAILRDDVVYGRPLRLAPDWYLENKKKRPLAVSFFHCWNNQIVFFKWLGSCFRHIITVLHAWFSHFPSR